MEYLQIVLSSFFSLVALFTLTKINGNRQISELTMFDYVIGISIGSIAAEMATELKEPLKPLIAMLVYALALFIISFATTKSLPFRRLVFGRSIILIRNGKMLKSAFKSARLDINEFLVQCRSQGYFDVTTIHTAVLEPNGKLSILAFPAYRPATPQDMKLTTETEEIFFCIIMDGEILHKNLQAAGFNEKWLNNELESRDIKNVTEIFFADLDKNGTLHIFENKSTDTKHDCFE